jgi:phosphoglycerate kinase
MRKMTLRDLPLKGKRVLMRVDFNVPMEGEHITDDTRIQAALPSIRYVLDHGGSLVLMSHLGKGGASLAPCAERLSELLGRPVELGEKKGPIVLLENLRNHPEEEKGDPTFAQKLARLGDCYVNDAFGTAHRSHASTVTITQFFPKASAMGFLMEKEIEKLSMVLSHPKRPFYAIIGGAKISEKLGMVRKLLEKVDGLFLGREIPGLDNPKIHWPLDWVGDKQDIGPKTIDDWKKKLQDAATVFWNGPLGVFEKKEFARGTQEIAKALAKSKATVVVGGGDSVAAIRQMGLASQFDHLSTGGGASLEFLEFGHLPGIDALSSI